MKYDWKQLPENMKIPVYKVNVHKNDILFVPAWWWHQPVSITRSKHVAIRTVHESTFNHKLFMPEYIYKFVFLLPYFYWNTDPTNNTYLNNSLVILEGFIDF